MLIVTTKTMNKILFITIRSLPRTCGRHILGKMNISDFNLIRYITDLTQYIC